MSLSDTEKAALVDDSRALYERVAEKLGKPVRTTHACLYHAVALQMLLAQRHGVNTMIQAGSCQWPMVTDDNDDGVSASHFSYQWEGLDHPDVLRELSNARLPELHVWLAHRDPDTIIDPTTGTWPERARDAGYTWSAPNPPPFLWHTGGELASLVAESFTMGVTYGADPAACRVADAFAGLELYPAVAKALGIRRRR